MFDLFLSIISEVIFNDLLDINGMGVVNTILVRDKELVIDSVVDDTVFVIYGAKDVSVSIIVTFGSVLDGTKDVSISVLVIDVDVDVDVEQKLYEFKICSTELLWQLNVLYDVFNSSSTNWLSLVDDIFNSIKLILVELNGYIFNVDL